MLRVPSLHLLGCGGLPPLLPPLHNTQPIHKQTPGVFFPSQSPTPVLFGIFRYFPYNNRAMFPFFLCFAHSVPKKAGGAGGLTC